MTVPYDSTADTLLHIRRVQTLLGEAAAELIRRGAEHDASKLGPEEKPFYDRAVPKIRAAAYGSDAYLAAVDELGAGLDHHMAVSSHHPEHHEDGVDGMTLFDVLEMLLDWKAASERRPEDAFDIAHNVDRFEIGPQLGAILTNTVRELGWTPS